VPTSREIDSGDVKKRAFVPPLPPGSWCQWWMFRRYGGVPHVTSGRMREITWPYTVARAEWIECERAAYRERKPTFEDDSSWFLLSAWFRINLPAHRSWKKDGKMQQKVVAAALGECAQLSAASSLPPTARPQWEEHLPSSAALPNPPDVGVTCSFDDSNKTSVTFGVEKPGELPCARGLRLAYCVLLSQPNNPALPASVHGGPPFSYFDYVHAMVSWDV